MTDPQAAHAMNVLVVDDAPATLDILSAWLKDAGYFVRAALSGELALQSAFAFPPTLVILDVRMQGMDGFQVCERLRANAATAEVPVIFVSGLTDVADRLRGFEVGGVDFLTKPVRREEVLARVHAQMRLRVAMEALNEVNRNLEAKVAERTADLIKERNIAQSYLDVAGVALFALDSAGLLRMMNRTGELLFGVEENTVLGVNWVDVFVHPQSKESVRDRCRELITQRIATSTHWLLNVVRTDGQVRTVSCSTKLLDVAGAGASGILFSAEDVTEVLQVQKALRLSEEKYRGYIENAPEAIFISDAAGRCVDANPAACQLFHAPSESITAQNFLHWVDPRDEELATAALAEAVSGRKSHAELRLITGQDDALVVSVGAILLDESRILWFCADVSKLRRAERDAVARATELDDALAQLRRLTAHMHDSIERERLALATDIHDHVGASLTGARLLLDQLGRTLTDIPKQQHAMLEQACAAVSQALVSSRGVYAQLRPPMLEDLGLVHTLRWYLDDWSQKTGVYVESFIEAMPQEPGEMPRMDIFRIFQELLTNVARHASASRVEVRMQVTSDCLVLRVSDDGCGMRANKHDGFGMQGIRGRLSRYGGSLTVENRNPKGTVITACIPSNALLQPEQ
jgi:PAS domain S-box-containing protein